MSIFASILRAVYRLSGVKKSFTLPENELRMEIEKQNRHRGVFTPTDHKAYYETITVNGFPCLIVRGPKQLPVSILVLPCIRRGIGPVRSPCDRSALVAQYKTHPFLVFAGEEILSGSEKAYRIVFARNAAVCRDRRADSPDRYRTLKQYMGDAPRCMASSNTPTRECNDLPYLRT